MTSQLPRFVQQTDTPLEDFPWCRCHWLCRPGLVDAQQLLLVEAHMPARQAHQFHYHPHMEELIYVLSGRAEQWVEREARVLSAGEMAHIPQGAVHATYNPFDEELRFLAMLSPAKVSGPAVVDVFREEPWRSLKQPIDYGVPYQSPPQAADKPSWDQRYAEGGTPWDSGLPSRELARVLDEGILPRGRAIELGCGTGTNAILLAQRGYDVTAIDLSPKALAIARTKAMNAGVNVRFVEADVTALPPPDIPYDLLFDRGCYHCVRREQLDGYLAALVRLTRPGAKCLLLAGNCDEEAGTCGMPRVRAEEICAELGRAGAIERLRAFRFEDAGHVEGPLGWSCLMTRK
jgi:quercetin dioxygenase-like cupin family protein/2-polyprenyl-3-methyl-5-hydroxy-6-metoxy-1,4-benzoquinol methylase